MKDRKPGLLQSMRSQSQTRLSNWRRTAWCAHCRAAGGSAPCTFTLGPRLPGEAPCGAQPMLVGERRPSSERLHWLPPESHTWPFPSHGAGESSLRGCTRLQQLRKSNHMMCLGKSDTLHGQKCPSDHGGRSRRGKKQSKGEGIWGGGLDRDGQKRSVWCGDIRGKTERESVGVASCREYSKGTGCLACWRSSKEVWMLVWSEQGASWRKVGQRSKSKLWDTSQHLAVRAVAIVGCCKDVIWLRFWKDPVAAMRVEPGRGWEALAINQIRLERGQCSASGCSLKVEPTEFASVLLEEKEDLRLTRKVCFFW